jgi:cytochrome c553
MNILKALFLVFSTSMLLADAQTLYMHKCAGCHGHNAENSVLGKSKILNQMKAEEIEQALYNYAEGICAIEVEVCEPKNPMIQHGKKAILQSLTKEQIHELSIYVSQLK